MIQRWFVLGAFLLGVLLGSLADGLLAQSPVQIQVYGPGGFQPISAAPQTGANSFPVALPSDQTPNATPGGTAPAMSTAVAGIDASGLIRTMAVTPQGQLFVVQQPAAALPLPACNPVRNYSCQPKGF